ncbi:MAG TPA: ABC transporter permease [Acidobacteriota bacterium]|nr:ABC transporter permease [Acidobacteriota bacterium]
MQSLKHDVREAWRSIRRNPGLSLTLILTLALGISANTVVFNLVNGLVLKPLPVSEPNELAVVAVVDERDPVPQGLSMGDYRDYRDQVEEFSSLAAYRIDSAGLSTGKEAVRAMVSYVTPNYFPMLGIKAAHGALLSPSGLSEKDYQPLIVLGYGCWKRLFGADPAAVGRTVWVNGERMTVAGITPEGFRGTYSLLEMDAYLPLAMDLRRGAGSDPWTDRGGNSLRVLGRLRPGATLEQAQASLRVVSARLAAEYPKTNRERRTLAVEERWARPEPLMADFLPLVVSIFLGLVLMVLLVAAFNAFNLLMARALGQQAAMAVRSAMGARRSRLVRQFMTEVFLLSILGGLAGLFAGLWGSRFLAGLDAASDFPLGLDLSGDWRVWAYALGLSLLAGLLLGVLPAIRASGGPTQLILGPASRGAVAQSRVGWVRSALVTSQVAISVLLLVAAGLFLRSLQKASDLELGFEPQGVLNVSIDPGLQGYSSSRAESLFQQLTRRARALPGVESAAMAYSVPMGYFSYAADIQAERWLGIEDSPKPDAGFNLVGPGYFETLNIPLIKGRPLSEEDHRGGHRVAVVNLALANRLWPGRNPIGKRFSYQGEKGPLLEVVGVTPEGVFESLFAAARPYFFIPMAHNPQSLRTLHLRTQGPPAQLASDVRRLVRELDSNMPVFDVQTMEQSLASLNGFFIPRLAAGLASVVGLLGLFLAVIGVYGVVSYASRLRKHEFGIRMALGARRRDVLKLVSRQGLALVVGGLVTGAAAALLLSQVVSGLLFGVAARDLPTFLLVVLLLFIAGMAASVLPAHRAAKTDPALALRSE